MTETEMRLIHLSHYPNSVRQERRDTPCKRASSGKGGDEAADGRSLGSWVVGAAVSLAGALFLVQLF